MGAACGENFTALSMSSTRQIDQLPLVGKHGLGARLDAHLHKATGAAHPRLHSRDRVADDRQRGDRSQFRIRLAGL